MAGHVVTAAPDRDGPTLLAREPYGGDHVGHAPAADDQERPAVNHSVPHRAGGIVPLVGGGQRLAAEAAPRAFDRSGEGGWVGLVLRLDVHLSVLCSSAPTL
jgi:hypothetical protein